MIGEPVNKVIEVKAKHFQIHRSIGWHAGKWKKFLDELRRRKFEEIAENREYYLSLIRMAKS